jgi:hypothetical protein
VDPLQDARSGQMLLCWQQPIRSPLTHFCKYIFPLNMAFMQNLIWDSVPKTQALETALGKGLTFIFLRIKAVLTGIDFHHNYITFEL